MPLLNKKPLWWIKLTNYEYWPFMFFYLPTSLYWSWLILKSRSLTFFSLVNPPEEFGGIFGMQKGKALQMVDPYYLPRTFMVPFGSGVDYVEKERERSQISYPFIIKPNSGERGVNVELMRRREDLENYLNKVDRDCIVQEFIEAPVELGVFYVRFPENGKSRITGIVDKRLLTLKGDGKSTVYELMEQNDRARFQLKRLSEKMPDIRTRVPAKGEEFIMEYIGNHNRGTMFLNASHLINDRLTAVFDRISSGISGFYYGRYDVKVQDLEAMYRGEGIKVMEVNGVYSEPAHIYDPGYGLWNAYKEIIRHMRIIYLISKQNKKRGMKTISFTEFFKLVWENFFGVKRLV